MKDRTLTYETNRQRNDEAGAASNPSNLSATINWGDGNSSQATLVPLGGGSYSVQGTNVYAEAGSYGGTVQVNDAGGSSASLSFTTGVSDAALDPGSPETISTTEGQTYSGEVGTFYDEAGSYSNASDLSATINFGDGNSSPATIVPIGGGSYSVQTNPGDMHVYVEAGIFNGTVSIQDIGGSSVSGSFSAYVADAPLDAGSPETLIATAGLPSTGNVGAFFDEAGSSSAPSDLSGTIDWGDGGALSTATITPLGGGSYAIATNPGETCCAAIEMSPLSRNRNVTDSCPN
jgi:hypothetical protein